MAKTKIALLYEHLSRDDELQGESFSIQNQLVKDQAQRQGITERLKAENQMEWAGCMNNCKAQAEEIIMAESIYVQGDYSC